MFAKKSSREAILKSFVCACLYYCMLNPSGFLPTPSLPARFARLIIGVLHIIDFLLQVLIKNSASVLANAIDSPFESVLGTFSPAATKANEKDKKLN